MNKAGLYQFRYLFLGCLFYAFFLSLPSSAQSILRDYEQIRQMDTKEAGNQYPVEIEGQVLHFHPDLQRIFVYDGKTVLYVQLQRPPAIIPGLRIGSNVRVRGVTGTGGYSPIIYSEFTSVRGWQPLPAAKSVSRSMYLSPSTNTEWVEAVGRPVAVEQEPVNDYLVISFEIFTSVIDVHIPYTEKALAQLEPLMFRDVRVKGVLGTKANEQHQMTDRILFVSSMNDFELATKGDEDIPEFVPIHKLASYAEPDPGLVKTRGTLVYSTPNGLYLLGEKNSLEADIMMNPGFKPGDVLELTGYAVPQPISPSFQTVSIEKVDEVASPVPQKISLKKKEGDWDWNKGIDLNWNNALVSLDAEFMYLGKTFIPGLDTADVADHQNIVQETLWCQFGPILFEARLPKGTVATSELRPGSRVRLAGICHVLHSKHPRVDRMAESLWIELPGPEAVEVIRQASWWTAKRLLRLMLAGFFLFLLLVVWIVALRKTVAVQTRTIGKQVERETVLHERHRIARELHDTLEQGLAALACQLKRISNKARLEKPVELPLAEEAEDILEACRKESRASIQDLRGGLLEKMDMPTAIPEVLKPQLVGTDVKLDVKVNGAVKRLPLFLEHQVMRIIAEAARNAILHAAPSNIVIQLSYGSENLQVIIQDDGCGFDTDLLEHTERYGIQGMKERAVRISGTLSVESTVGSGTEITMILPMENAERKTG